MKSQRFVLAIVILTLLLSATVACAARRTFRPRVTGPMIVSWDPNCLGKGTNLVELQIYRDPGEAGPTAPFYVIRNPLVIEQGYIDLTPLYAAGASAMPIGHTVDFSLINIYGNDVIPSTYEWSPEGYGVPHTYQVCAIGMKQPRRRGQYSFDFTRFPVQGAMTCVEPVTCDPDHIVTPAYGEPVLISDLNAGSQNLSWISVAGATEYMVTVQPVDSRTGPTWRSHIIYYYSGPWSDGATLALSDADRSALASLLSSGQLADRDILWRVDARNGADPKPYWTIGDWSVFHIIPTPSGPPSP